MEKSLNNPEPLRIRTISELHQLRGLSQPEHPLVSVVDYRSMKPGRPSSVILDFYSISIKRGGSLLRYGQQQYDFNEGVMFFIAPNQVFGASRAPSPSQMRSGWILYFHPDFLWNTSLAKTIHQYEFLGYNVNEALFLSAKEEAVLNQIIKNIEHECHSNIDKFSRDIIVAHIETLLNYARRFYERQFITRKISSHEILSRLESLLGDYFANGLSVSIGLPTVSYVADNLNISKGYLSSLLKSLTGKTTQEHIHEKLIEIAKLRLSATTLSVSEIAYELGFEHVQAFHKLFKTKTEVSPMQFRNSFN